MSPNMDNQLMFFAARQIRLRWFFLYRNKINVFMLCFVFLVYSFFLATEQNKPFSDAQIIRTCCIA